MLVCISGVKGKHVTIQSVGTLKSFYTSPAGRPIHSDTKLTSVGFEPRLTRLRVWHSTTDLAFWYVLVMCSCAIVPMGLWWVCVHSLCLGNTQESINGVL